MDSREKSGSRVAGQSASRKRQSEGKMASKPPLSKSVKLACFGSSDSSDQEEEQMDTDQRFSKYSRWLLKNVEGLTEPSSLLSWGGKKLADWCNKNLTLPVRDLPSQMQAATCPLLTPRLFVLHLKRYGGLLGLKRRMYLDDFQPVLQRLFDLRHSLSKVSFYLHRYIKTECDAYLARLKKRRRTDHGFNRLFLKHHNQQMTTACKIFDINSVQRENKNSRLGIDHSWLCLRLYELTNHFDTTGRYAVHFVQDLDDPCFQIVNTSWTKENQFRFYDTLTPLKLQPPSKIKYEPAAFCRDLLLAATKARTKAKHHAVAYLCARLLVDPVFQNQTNLKTFRVYAWCLLAKSLAQLYVRLDIVLAFLDRALAAAAYQTDKLLVYNAKQHALAIYGCHLAERDLFEHVLQEKLAPQNSKLFDAVCAKHILSVIRQNEDSLLESACLKAELSKGPNPGALAGLKKKLGQVKNRCSAMSQFIKSSRRLHKICKRAAFRFSLQKCCALFLEEKEEEALSVFAKIDFNMTFAGLGGATYDLLRTKFSLGNQNISNFAKYLEKVNKTGEAIEKDGDWSNHVNAADYNFELLAALFATGLAEARPRHALDLIKTTITTYDTVSAHLTHHRLPILKQIEAVLEQKEPLPIFNPFPGLGAKQKKANLKICKELSERVPADFFHSLNDRALLDCYVSRDAHYLKTIFTFGKESVQKWSGI